MIDCDTNKTLFIILFDDELRNEHQILITNQFLSRSFYDCVGTKNLFFFAIAKIRSEIDSYARKAVYSFKIDLYPIIFNLDEYPF